jgi:ABC-2 type transport system permease protein
MRLLGVELTRFRSRRAIVLMLVAAALLTTLLAVTTIWDTRPVSAEDRAAAEATARAEADSPFFQREMARCERNPERFVGPGATAEACDQMLPQAEWYLQRRTLDLADERSSSGLAVIVLVAGLLMVVGTTFAGADWASGSVSNQLLFEPRRNLVWLAKAGAVLVGSLAAATVIVGAYWLTLYLVAESRGISTSSTVLEAIRWSAARGILLAGAGAAGAYALTMLLRHTVGTLAFLFAYAIGGEILIASLPFQGIGRWSLANNVFAWLRDGHDYYDASVECRPDMDYCAQTIHLTAGDGAWFLAAMLLLVGALSFVLFRRRDVP